MRIVDALVIALSGLVAGLAALVGFGFGLLILGCLAALLVFLSHGRFGLAATQVPAIAVMSVVVWLCWRALKKEIRILDSVLKEGASAEDASAGGPGCLSKEAKLRVVVLNLLALAMCLAVGVAGARILHRLLGPRLQLGDQEPPITASYSSYVPTRSNPRLA